MIERISKQGLYSGNLEPEPVRRSERFSLTQIVRDTQRHARDTERNPTDPETDCRVSANVGCLMAVAIAAAGSFAITKGGATACETDFLAASGATFPATVTYEQMVDFNRRTLRPEMDEEDEMARYAAIADFFNRRSA